MQKLGFTDIQTICKSNNNKTCAVSGEQYKTPSPALNDSDISETSFQEKDYYNQRNFRVVTPTNYSRTQHNTDLMTKTEESEIKNIQKSNSSCKNTATTNFKMLGMNILSCKIYNITYITSLIF